MSALIPLRRFFQQSGLRPLDFQTCLAFVRRSYPESTWDIDELAADAQGGCSYTILVVDKQCKRRQIVQFRLIRYAIPIDIAREASRWYGDLAPIVELLGYVEVFRTQLQACRMSVLPGVSFSCLQPTKKKLDDREFRRCRTLVESLACLHARAWRVGVDRSAVLGRMLKCDGKVGSTIVHRLDRLRHELPSHFLRQTAGKTLAQFERLQTLPVVLTHGDFLPGNVLVDPDTWAISGLVDWAEGEYLPFGISFYGLDHLLGYWAHAGEGEARRFGSLDADDARVPRFIYYAQAPLLRGFFWQRLRAEIEALGNEKVRQAVDVARDVGVLLWHGFAWDEGRIDRVVGCTHRGDAEELEYLYAFLSPQKVILTSSL